LLRGIVLRRRTGIREFRALVAIGDALVAQVVQRDEQLLAAAPAVDAQRVLVDEERVTCVARNA
jgi:hypothetical protein